MQIFVSLPGQHNTPVIVSDSATFADFCREAHKETGCSVFAGLQHAGQGTVYTSPLESHVLKATIYNITQASAVSLATTTFSTALSSIFNNNDSILLLNVPVA